jgi:DNA-binding transcriptional MerR regulator
MTDDAWLSIGEVERETGIARDTLRVWERRYGFPDPGRDPAGDRIYSQQQLQRLQLIRRLLNRGMRPGKVVPLSQAQLQALDGESTSESPATNHALSPLLEAILAQDAQGLIKGLEEAQAKHGLRYLVIDLIAPLLAAIGEAWATGRLEIFEEHFASRELSRFLDSAVRSLPQPASKPQYLLATLQGEPHGFGLLMVEALLRDQGQATTNLGPDLPMTQIISAAKRIQPKIVILSFSGNYPYSGIRRDLTELAQQLPEGMEIWVGGEGVRKLRKRIPGVKVMGSLRDLCVVG